jgi:hypothetical protein
MALLYLLTTMALSADVDERVAFVGRQVQSRQLIANHEEAFPMDALDLDPVAEAAGTVKCVAPFGDETFKPMLAGRVEQRLSVTFEFLRQSEPPARSCRRSSSMCRRSLRSIRETTCSEVQQTKLKESSPLRSPTTLRYVAALWVYLFHNDT